MSETPSPLQRYALGLDESGQPTLSYDMQGDVVRFDDHRRALNTERSLADDRVALAERQAAEDKGPQKTKETLGFHATLRALQASVEALRSSHDWTDGDIIFAADLTPEDRSDATLSAFDGGKDQ